MSRRRTESLTRVAVAMMRDPFGRHYGYGLMEQAHIRSGVLYPILERMLEDGWVKAEWETPGATEAKRPRRYYTLTTKGRQELGAIEADAALDPRFGYLLRGV